MPETQPHQTVSIILAAGNGTRMCSANRHKVTLPVNGVPAIERAIRMYGACGVDRHIVVVGALADQVRTATLGATSNAVFAVQSEQLGTAHATRVGADLMKAEGFNGDILVAAGDKVMEPAAVERLIAAYRETDCAMAFLVGRASDFPNAGRVVIEDGNPVSVIEVADIARARLLHQYRRLAESAPVPSEMALSLARQAFPTNRKAAKALGTLWLSLNDGVALTAESISLPDPVALRAESAELANLSVYMFRAPALYAALDGIGADNAQGEQYLTDAVMFLAARGERVTAVEVAHPFEVMAFNTPEEYAEVRRHFERPIDPTDRWDVATAFEGRFSVRPAFVARAPGRLNLMGRHVDHQGGASNLIAINRSLSLAVSPRSDGLFHLSSVDPSFPDREFGVNPPAYAADWVSYVNSPAVRQLCASLKGDWSLYVRAAVERLQAEAGRPLRGMNIVASGNIPIAAGLSSSSALVVATAEAILALNGLNVARDRLVELCGEAEWFVGTRGGAGDHAAMILGREGHVTQVGYFPFAVIDWAPMPGAYTFVVFNSGIAARKTAEAKHTFNARVACFHVGRELLKKLAAPGAQIRHLHDITLNNMGIKYPAFLRLLRQVPERLTVAQARSAVPDDVAETYLSQLPDDEVLPIRGVVIYGLAECARSENCLELLHSGDVATFGRWMTVSHNGDRATPVAYTDERMDRWIELAESRNPASAVELQPGAYACSMPAIDRMVDIALAVPGVLGAQLSGAGLGGCMMVLCEDAALDRLEEATRRDYYEPNAIDPDVIRCRAASGSTVE